MTPNAVQTQVLEHVRRLPELHPEGGTVTVVSGPAGTGKTSLLKFLASEFQDTFVLAPTGKAAVRVREATGLLAMTIHKWMYIPDKDEQGNLCFRPKQTHEVQVPEQDVLIVDEASMLGRYVWEQLHVYARALGLNIVLIGDGYQLPPVEKADANPFSVFAPDFVPNYSFALTEIFRQALESPIVRTCNAIRLGTPVARASLEIPSLHKSQIPDRLQILSQDRDSAVICHRNLTRHDTNVLCRQLAGRGPGLEAGEPLLVLKNNYNLDWYNGEVYPLGALKTWREQPVLDRRANKSQYLHLARGHIQEQEFVLAEEEVFGRSVVDPDAIQREIRFLARNSEYPQLENSYLSANLGYALTCHKSQGSEWRRVLVYMEPSIKILTPDGRRWAYTAFSRAREELQLYWTE